jgi:hypothetical protein
MPADFEREEKWEAYWSWTRIDGTFWTLKPEIA